jgi:hypothetical protein
MPICGVGPNRVLRSTATRPGLSSAVAVLSWRWQPCRPPAGTGIGCCRSLVPAVLHGVICRWLLHVCIFGMRYPVWQAKWILSKKINNTDTGTTSHMSQPCFAYASMHSFSRAMPCAAALGRPFLPKLNGRILHCTQAPAGRQHDLSASSIQLLVGHKAPAPAVRRCHGNTGQLHACCGAAAAICAALCTAEHA